MPSSQVMSKWKAGTLHSGSKSGPPVKSQKQALAIMFSEKRKEGQHGGKYPHKASGGPQGPTGMPPLPPAVHPSSMAPPYMGGVGGLPGIGPPAGLGGPPMGMRADGGPVPQFLEDFVTRMTGRTPGQRKFYNDTRAGLLNPATAPETGSTYGGLGLSLGERRRLQMHDAQGIEDAVMGNGYQFGGSPTSMGLTPGWIERQEARGMTHTGPIISGVGGRTDHHPLNVPSGSYVMPADSVSHLGQGNTLNGMQILHNMFGSPKLTHGSGPPRPPAMMRPPRMTSSGGSRGDSNLGRPVPIAAAGGEFVIPPEAVQRIGGGDLDHGHKILDHWVLGIRKKHIKKLQSLPPPAKS